MTDTEKIIDKVQKLHAHAESAKKIGNEAEAQAFAAKVQELLAQYKLSMSDVEFARRDEDDPIEEREVRLDAHGFKRKKARVAWQEQLAVIVGRAYFCRTLCRLGSNRVWFVGRVSDRAVAEFMFVTLVRFLDDDGKPGHGLAGEAYGEYYRACVKAGDVTLARGFRSSFLLGFIIRLAARFDEEARKQRAAVATTSTAIVRLTNALAEVDAYMKKYGASKTSSLSGSSNLNDEGYRRGRSAADAIDLRAKAIEHGASRPNGLLN